MDTATKRNWPGGGADLPLRLNDISIVDPSGRLYTAMISIATHQLEKLGLAKLLSELAGVAIANPVTAAPAAH